MQSESSRGPEGEQPFPRHRGELRLVAWSMAATALLWILSSTAAFPPPGSALPFAALGLCVLAAFVAAGAAFFELLKAPSVTAWLFLLLCGGWLVTAFLVWGLAPR